MSQKPKRLTPDEIFELFISASSFPSTLLFIRAENLFYIYKAPVYEPATELEQLVYRELLNLKREGVLPANTPITLNLAKEITSLLRFEPTVKQASSSASPYIAFSDNIIYNTETRKKTLASPDHLTFIKYNFPSTVLQATANPPKKFFAFLNTTFKGDTEVIAFIQQMIGYLLIPSTRAHAAFFLYGGGQNGKSVLLEIISALFPPHLIARHKLDQLTTNRFRVADLVGKLVNITGEEESKYLRSDIFKDLVSGEPVTAERKYQGTFEFTPYCTFLFSTNAIPTFDGLNKAARRRLFIIPFKYTVPDDEKNPNLAREIIEEELHQVFAFAIEGAQQLMDQKFHLRRPESLKQAQLEYENKQSASLDFFNENYQLSGNLGDFVKRSEMYNLYKEWSEEVNRKPVSRQRFFDELESTYGSDDFTTNGNGTAHIPHIQKSVRAVQGCVPTADKTAFYHERNTPVSLKPEVV